MHVRARGALAHAMASITETAKCLRLLGNERRLRIVVAAAQHPHAVHELCALLHCSQAATSKHLRRLYECGMVEREQVGPEAVYRTQRKHPFVALILRTLS